MNCFYHSDRASQHQCFKCGKAICNECALTDGYKAICRSCYETVGAKNVNRNYSKFWGFLLSLIPGAGQMYLGLMEQGLLIMLSFFGIITLMSTLFFTPILPFLLVVVWFYSFFDAYHIKKKIDNHELIIEKTFLNFKVKTAYYAYGFITIGALVLFNEVFDNIIRDLLTWHQIARIRNMFFPLLLIIIGGLILLRIKKSEAVVYESMDSIQEMNTQKMQENVEEMDGEIEIEEIDEEIIE